MWLVTAMASSYVLVNKPNLPAAIISIIDAVLTPVDLTSRSVFGSKRPRR